jgi:hypothetical protein
MFSSRAAAMPMEYALLAAVFLMGGFMFLCVGVLGEYVGRVYDEVRGRPLSIIRKVYAADRAYRPAQLAAGLTDRDSERVFPAA